MILAAGLGTRLRPYTSHRPKALFTLNGEPMLGLAIEKLKHAGFRSVLVNTHHLHRQIEAFLSDHDFGIPVIMRHEPDILGTGGALRNMADAWQSEDLLVFNADIATDIDLGWVYQYHQSHAYPVTMVMHDHIDFNNVAVDEAEFVTGFRYMSDTPGSAQAMAFTGIHVLSPRVLDYLPAAGPANIIQTYTEMLSAGEMIKALVVRDHMWHDIGTPERYRRAAVEHMAPAAFQAAFGKASTKEISRQTLCGDGSDRRWHRMTQGSNSLIMADHGILPGHGQQEVDAYIAIGQHLQKRGVPVPRIFLHDRGSGLVFVEDLGDTLLQTKIAKMAQSEIADLYKTVIDNWINMAVEGHSGFDRTWTYQTPYYDRGVIIEKECRYFLDAFIRGHLGWDETYAVFASEFNWIADQIERHAVIGFLHRDFQARNIMVKDRKVFYIDFQGGRTGPLQYDLASLLIDPYAALPHKLQRTLLDHAVSALHSRYGIDPLQFENGYPFCALARNLQMLGAFAYLNDRKGKTWFAQYIPLAVEHLHRHLAGMDPGTLPRLTELVEKLLEVKPEKV